jgi:hypothetical protein
MVIVARDQQYCVFVLSCGYSSRGNLPAIVDGVARRHEEPGAGNKKGIQVSHWGAMFPQKSSCGLESTIVESIADDLI